MLVFEPEVQAKKSRAESPAAVPYRIIGFQLLGVVGAGFALVGGIDLLVAWVPQAFGQPEWEFGTITQTLDGIPVCAIGLAMLLTGALAEDNRRLARTVAGIFMLIALAIVAMAVLYVTVLPLALRAVPDPTIRQGLMKAMVKTITQAVVYPTVFTWVGIKAWRSTAAR